MIRLDHRIPADPSRAAKPTPITFGLCFPFEETVLQEIEVATGIGKPLPAGVVKLQQQRCARCLASPSYMYFSYSTIERANIKLELLPKTLWRFQE